MATQRLSERNIFSKMLLKMKEWFFLFIDWREYRIVRFRALPLWIKTVNTLFTAFVIFLFYLLLVDINFLWLFGKSPTLKAIANPTQPLTTEIISADGRLIGKYYTENRKEVKFDDISSELINTLISTEDKRFYSHHGIDTYGLISATKDIFTGNPRGASTITQQLVKNMYKTRSQYSTGILGSLPGLRLLISKTKEWTAALKLEYYYSKKEILTMYLNTVSFGSNAYGIYTASNTFFDTTPDKLNYEQSAVLVGLLKAITRYNPYLNPEKSKKRRNLVIQQLAKNEYISQLAADSLKEIPITLNISRNKPNEGIAPYFRDYLTKVLEHWGETNGYDIYADGLKVHVTIDYRMQQYAEKSVKKHMSRLQRQFFNHWSGRNPWRDEKGKELTNFIPMITKRSEAYKLLSKEFDNNQDSIQKYLNLPQKRKVFDYAEGEKEYEMSILDSIRYMNHFLHCGFVAIEPNTRHVKVWVGDVDYTYWKYDKVEQSKRQPGSTFKLFVYAAGIAAGKSPCDRMTDEPFVWKYGNVSWQPNNANRKYSYINMTLKRGFAKSVNTIAAQLAKEVGIANVAKTAYDMGIRSKLAEQPALSLGASDVNLLEMVNSYSTVVAEGMYQLPIVITRIVDKDGYTIYQNKNKPIRRMTYENAFLMTEMLKAGISEPGGTSRALYNYDLMRWDTEFGGKTGSSSNYSDGWYIGVTPNLVAGSWVGAEHRSIHFRSGYLGQGSRTALPIFAGFMEKVLLDKSLSKYRAKFPADPKEIIYKDYKCESVDYYDNDSINNDTIMERITIEPIPLPEVELNITTEPASKKNRNMEIQINSKKNNE